MMKTLKPYWLLPWVLAAVLAMSSGCKKSNEKVWVYTDTAFCREVDAADFNKLEDVKAALMANKWQCYGKYKKSTWSDGEFEYADSLRIWTCEYRDNDSIYSRQVIKKSNGEIFSDKLTVLKYFLVLTPIGKFGAYWVISDKDYLTGNEIRRPVYIYLCKDKQTLVWDYNYISNGSATANYTLFKPIIK